MAKQEDLLSKLFGGKLSKIESTRLNTQLNNMVNLLEMEGPEVNSTLQGLRGLYDNPRGTPQGKASASQIVQAFMGKDRQMRDASLNRAKILQLIGGPQEHPVFGQGSLRSRFNAKKGAHFAGKDYQALRKSVDFKRTGLYDLIEFMKRNSHIFKKIATRGR